MKQTDVNGVITPAGRVVLDCTTNTRDLGGLRTGDGRTIKSSVLFRTDAVLAPTARDQAVLAELAVRHAADFRSEAEVATNGANQYPSSVTRHAVQLLDDSTDALSIAIQAALRGGDASVLTGLLGSGKAEAIARDGVVNLVLSDAGRTGFGQIMRLLADDDGVPLIFNCTAGKDRTGLFAALVQRLLGVSEEDAMADYELSNVHRAAVNEATYTRLEAIGADRALLIPLVEQDGANLAGLFRAIDAAYGTFDEFLRAGLGLDGAMIQRIQDNLLV